MRLYDGGDSGAEDVYRDAISRKFRDRQLIVGEPQFKRVVIIDRKRSMWVVSVIFDNVNPDE